MEVTTWAGLTVYTLIILLRGEVWAHSTSFTPQLFIEVAVPSK